MSKRLLYLQTIIAIFALVIGSLGGYPGIKDFFSPHPNLELVMTPAKQLGYCDVTVINFGDSATDIKVTAFLMVDGGVEQAITKTIDGLPACKETPVHSKPIKFYFNKAKKGVKYSLIVKAECKEGEFASSEKTIEWNY